MTTALLDTHVLFWITSEPDKVSPAAAAAIEEAGEVAVSSVSWFELAWLAHRGRILVRTPLRSWLDELDGSVRSVSITPRIAEAAVTLPASFAGDPADRIIFATAMEQGWPLITKDQRMHVHSGVDVVW